MRLSGMPESSKGVALACCTPFKDSGRATRSFPDLDRAIEACRSDPLPVGAEGHVFDPAGVAAQAVDLPGYRIPDLDSRVGTTPNEQSAIGAERQAFYATRGIAQIVAQLFPGLRLPELDGRVRAGGGQERPIR